MKTNYFRAGAGAIIYNDEGKILVFKRAAHPIGVWQLQQGGNDIGEKPEETLWRELVEETGLVKDEFTEVIEYPKWTIYEYSDEIRLDKNNPEPYRLGQCHKWWFLKLKPDTEIDLAKATDEEFSDWRWTTFDELINESHELKKPVYEELRDYFSANILKLEN